MDALGLNGLAVFYKKTVQIAPLEQSISVCWIPVHRNVTTGGPLAKCVVMDNKVFRCFRSLEVVSQFRHALRRSFK